MFGQFRTVLFWLHLAAGVVAAAIIALMSITGVMLAYEQQMIAWAERDVRVAPPAADAAPLPPAALLAAAHEHEGDWPSGLTFAADPAMPVAARFGRRRTVLLDPYSGQVVTAPSSAMRDFCQSLRAWHRWLAMSGDGRPVGRSITGICNLLFVFLIVSGFVLWWPRRWNRSALRVAIWFRSGLRGRARDWNWHNVIGVWCALPLLLIAVSGATISYPWARSAIIWMAGAEPPPPPGPRGSDAPKGPPNVAGLDTALPRALAYRPGWQTVTLDLAGSDDALLHFEIDRGSGRQPQKRGRLSLERQTGDVVTWEGFGDQPRARQIRSILRFGHTGEIAGLPGQTLAAIVSAGAVVLCWTGIALALRRLRRRLGSAQHAGEGERDSDSENMSGSAVPAEAAEL